MGTHHFLKFVIWLVLLAQVVASCVPAPTASPISLTQTVTSKPQPTLEATATPFPASPIGMTPPDGAIAVREMPESLQVVVKDDLDVEKAVALLGGGGDQVKALIERARVALPNGVSFAELRIGTNKHWGTLVIGTDGSAYVWATADGVRVAALNPYGTGNADLQAFGLQAVGSADEVEFAQEQSGWVVLTKQNALWLDMAASQGEKPWQMMGSLGNEPVADERGLVRQGEDVFLYNEAVGGLVLGTAVSENVMVIDGLVHEWNASTGEWEGRGVSANAVENSENGVTTLMNEGVPQAVVDSKGVFRAVVDGKYQDENGKTQVWDGKDWVVRNPIIGSGLDETKQYIYETDERTPGVLIAKDETGAIVGVGNEQQLKSAALVAQELGIEPIEGKPFYYSNLLGGNYIYALENEQNGVRAVYDGETWLDLTGLGEIIGDSKKLDERGSSGYYARGRFADQRGIEFLAGVSLGVSEKPIKIVGTDAEAILGAQVFFVESRTGDKPEEAKFGIAWVIKEILVGQNKYALDNNEGARRSSDGSLWMYASRLSRGNAVLVSNEPAVNKIKSYMLDERGEVPELKKFLDDYFTVYGLGNVSPLVASVLRPVGDEPFAIGNN